MAYKPKMKQGGSFGPQGVAQIKINPQNSNQIKFRLKEKKWNAQTQATEEKEYFGDVSRSDCADKVRPLIRAGMWYISVNNELTKIFTVRPVTGMYAVKVDHISAPEGQQPAPKMSVGKFPYPYFTVILRVVEGAEKGMEIPYTLHYHFDKEFEPVEGDKPREVVAYNHPKSKHTAPLAEFCEATGVWDKGPMPFRDNILPMLQKRMQDQGRTFQVILADGQVRGVAGGTQFEDGFAPDVEE